MSNKYCVVPQCLNSTIKTPEKLFFHVPRDTNIRKKWMKAIRRVDFIGPKTVAFCCEDHFNVETDMENYIKHKLVGVGKHKLKKDIVPHKFACQNRLFDKPERSVVAKLKTARLKNKPIENIASTSHNIEQLFVVDPATLQEENVDTDPLKDPSGDTATENTNTTKKKHKKTQVNLTYKVSHKSTETDSKCFSLVPKDKKIIKIKKQKWLLNEELCTIFKEKSSLSEQSFSDYILRETDVTDSDSEFEKDSFKTYMQKAALLCISREPQMLLGLPKKWYCCIQLLSESCKCTPTDVMIVLKKIRLHQSNAILALDFGLTSGAVVVLFRKKLPLVASCMKTLVFFPKTVQVLANLPMPFRKRYSNVQGIIDCLEIQIQKPSNAVKQALTWSEYKSCNTIKYLISITPDGLINFISEGYGGRTSDSIIFEDCGILDLLPKNGAIMADRSFKNVSHLLQQRECFLIRPPSVSAKITPTKIKVLETKRIAALRIHVERKIGRLRNFGFLTPHATVDSKQVDLLDYVMMTACGIVNLQNSLFKLKN